VALWWQDIDISNMAHFAKLDENGIVIQVVVVNNGDVELFLGIEFESKGINFLKKLFSEQDRFVQTSYNGQIRKNFAGINYLYDSSRDAFIPPRPDEIEGHNVVFDETTCVWDHQPIVQNLSKRLRSASSEKTTEPERKIGDLVFPPARLKWWQRLMRYLKSLF
jgi:hypothetical protein